MSSDQTTDDVTEATEATGPTEESADEHRGSRRSDPVDEPRRRGR